MNNFLTLLRSLHRGTRIPSFLKTLIPSRFRQRLKQRLPSVSNVQWCRIVMNREIEQYIKNLECSQIDALEISGAGSQNRYGFRNYQTIGYPEYDICKEPLAREKFDLIIAEQVFEHVLRPDIAASNVYAMLKPGGRFVISTPFLLKIHPAPLDLYRWTEHGIRVLLETAGFEVVSTGAWGNRKCLLEDIKFDDGWISYDPLAHTLENEPHFPIVIWAFAQKKKSE